MSAVVGIFNLNGRPVNRADLERMGGILAHRGPDGAGSWYEGPVGFGHRLLWTTPESLEEKQPLNKRGADLVLTADARIDNRAELVSVLGFGGRQLKQITDSDLILAAYEKWGELCPERLVGDFVFAIWDGRKQRLFCARDPIGVKPLYYYYSSGHVFTFASEIKALVCLPQVPRQLNELKVADYLVRIFDDQAGTFYRDIFRLPAGHAMRVGSETIELRDYWSLDPAHEIRLKSDEEYGEAFREIFTEAVHCRLRSTFPVGSTLSGGLDSSSIACTARNLFKGEDQCLHTFSAIFPDLPETDLRKIDERPYIKAVLDTGGFEPHYICADRLSPLTELDRVLWHEDEAIFAPNLYMHWALYKEAQQQGVRIFLDGLDGDSVVSHGLDYFADLARTARWKTLFTEARAFSGRCKASVSPRSVIWQFGFRPLIPEPAVQVWRTLRGHSQPRWTVKSVINPAFARRVGLAARAQALQKNRSVPTRNAREKHWLSLRSALFPTAMEMADKAAKVFLLEPRYPFFDRRLIEFCLALPPTQKLNQGWTRMVMRRAMAGILPEKVQWRFGKANLSPNFKRRLLEYEREALDDVIMKQPEIIEGFVDVSALRSAYHRYAAEPLHRESDVFSVYSSVILARWLQGADVTW